MNTDPIIPSRWPLALAALLAALGAWGVLGIRTSEPTAASHRPPALEVLRSQLELRSGRLCLISNTPAETFAGVMTEYYPSGGLQSRSMVSNGLLEGLSQGWYTNGQLQVSEHFRAGVSDGLRTKWYANGQRQSEATVVNGELQGGFRRWREDGVLAEEMHLQHGQPDGEVKVYHPDGSLKSRFFMRKGKVVEQNVWAGTTAAVGDSQ